MAETDSGRGTISGVNQPADSLTITLSPAKLAALLAHTSQHVSTMDVAGADDAAGVAAFRRRVLEKLATWGRRAGVAHAEAFKLIEDL